jgi:hypothetical protein
MQYQSPEGDSHFQDIAIFPFKILKFYDLCQNVTLPSKYADVLRVENMGRIYEIKLLE